MTSSPSSNDSTKATSAQPPTGPASIRKFSQNSPRVRSSSSTTSATRTPTVSPTATQAFLKHANPSQGITELLLEAAFVPFGTVSKVEIDMKKHFAYVDFAEPKGLQNAIKASPIKVAQGQIVELERKTGPAPPARNMRGVGGPIRAAQQGTFGHRGGGPPAMVVNGGGAPMGPRGGRGGRGGGAMARGGMGGQNMNEVAPSPTAGSISEEAAAAADPAKPSPANKPSTAQGL